MLLLPLFCTAQQVRNPSYSTYEVRIVCEGEVLEWGKLDGGGFVEIGEDKPVQVFYKCIEKVCDDKNPERVRLPKLPTHTKYRNIDLPNGWRMIKVDPHTIQNLPLQICSGV